MVFWWFQGGNKLIALNSLNIKSEIWRWSSTTSLFYVAWHKTELVTKLDRAWPKKWNCNWELLNQNNRRKYWFYHSAVKFPWSEERKILSQRFRRSKITFETQEQRQSLIVLHWDLSNYINFLTKSIVSSFPLHAS